MHKIYWVGPHAKTSVSSPVGKLHKEGLDLLKSAGWVDVGPDTQLVPVLAFTTRKGANFPATGNGLPRIRQLPQQCTAVLDDKRRMADCIAHLGISPQTWADVNAFLAEYSPQSGTTTSTSAATAAGGGDWLERQCELAFLEEAPQPSTPTWFLKHRKGVKGQAVYCYASLEELSSKLSSLSTRSRRDFVVQRGVEPLLLRGRKFVLRAHVLLLLQATRVGGSSSQGPQAFLHRDVIVVEHAQPYSPDSSARAVHISSCGRGHPRPYLLTQLQEGFEGDLVERGVHSAAYPHPAAAAMRASCGVPNEAHTSPSSGRHPLPQQQQQQAASMKACPLAPALLAAMGFSTRLQRSIWEQICSAAAASLVAGAGAGLVPQHADPQAVLYHMFGYDFTVDQAGKVQLLEVNAYPAIASGTMAAVDRKVYTKLVKDLLGLFVLPVTDGVPPDPGGFVELDLLGRDHP